MVRVFIVATLQMGSLAASFPVEESEQQPTTCCDIFYRLFRSNKPKAVTSKYLAPTDVKRRTIRIAPVPPTLPVLRSIADKNTSLQVVPIKSELGAQVADPEVLVTAVLGGQSSQITNFTDGGISKDIDALSELIKKRNFSKGCALISKIATQLRLNFSQKDASIEDQKTMHDINHALNDLAAEFEELNMALLTK